MGKIKSDSWIAERLGLVNIGALADATGIDAGRIRRFRRGDTRGLYSHEASMIMAFFERLAADVNSIDGDVSRGGPPFDEVIK